jgi:hypothetical protein
MTPRQRLFRAVNWAFGLTLGSIAVLVFGIGLCQPAATTVVRASIVIPAGQETRPTSGVYDQAWEEWEAQQKPVRDATYDMAAKMIFVTALFIGVPTAVLLTGVCVLLYRAKVWLRRGA